MRKLLELAEPPTAVFAAADMMAIGAMRAVQAAGLRVPDDAAVVGFDDIEIAPLVSPALTTIRQDKVGLGLAAARAIVEHVGRPLGLDAVAAAWAIHHVVNEAMAAAARMHAVERGKDARAFPLFAFGGAGPVHAYGVATTLGVREILCPFAAGVGSTVGFLAAPLAFDFVRSHYGLLDRPDRLDWAAVQALYEEMEENGRRLLAGAAVPLPQHYSRVSLHQIDLAPSARTARRPAPPPLNARVPLHQIHVARTADMRLFGQAHQLSVPIPNGPLGPDRFAAVLAAFEDAYRSAYQRTCPGVPVEALTWRVRVSGPPPELHLRYSRTPAQGSPVKGQRPVYFAEAGGFCPTPVYDRYRLRPGDQFAGPAVVEEAESTVVVGPGGTVTVDEYLNLIVRLPG
jgi:N-methylhydantoinase A